MRYAHEVSKVRSAEEALMAQLPDGTLMRRAAAGLAAVCVRLLPHVYGSSVALLIGGGDNGGDALHAGARLARRGARVTAVQAGSRIHRDGLAALRAAGGRLLDAPESPEAAREIGAADLIIDGLTGIGGSGGLREPYAGLAARAGAATGLVVACDVPSGVDATSGVVAGAAVRADVTVTFGTYKPGLLIDPGAAHCGVVELIDIGLGPHLPDPDVAVDRPEDLRPPRPGFESDKYRRGVVGILAGSEGLTGAAVLSTGAAIRGGAGMVRFAATRDVVELVRRRWPEAVTTVVEAGPGALERVGRVQAWVAGPGLGTGENSEALIASVLATDLPVIVDADGLTVLARRHDLLLRPAPTVLTPHAGELARLLGAEREDIEARRLEHVRRAAVELSSTVLLKGSTTLVAEADRPVRVNPTGTSWLATAGTGDVLSGLIGALLAGGMAPLDAAAAAAYLHGLAGRLAAADHVPPRLAPPPGRGEAPIGAFDVITALPDAFRTLP